MTMMMKKNLILIIIASHASLIPALFLLYECYDAGALEFWCR